jgi:N-acetylglutamate synthase-like GNAT family acetyltransferase
MVVEIRPATEADCGQIRAIHEELRRPRRESYEAKEYLLAWIEGVAVGCAATTAHEDGVYFHGLAVRKGWQRKGVGGELMQGRCEREGRSMRSRW